MKKLKKRIIGLVMLAVMLSVGTGCGNRADTEKNTEQNETYTYVDCVGREIELPKKMERIAAIDSFSGELMVMIGAGEQMVACANGTKSDLLLQEIYPGLTDVAVVQGGGAINAEALLELNPDVVLLKYEKYKSGEKEKLDKLGIPYLVVGYTNMEEQIDAIRLVGQVAGGKAEEKAEKICDYYQKTIDLATEKKKQIPEEEQLSVYHCVNMTYRTDGVKSLGADWISTVGCINCSAIKSLTTDRDGYLTNKEQVFVWDPDVVICNDRATAEYFNTDEEWAGLRAVQEGKVYNIPISATRWGQQGSVETYFGMLWLGTTVYPEVYSDVDLKSEVCDFYSDVLGISIDDELYEQILSGTGLRKAPTNSK